MRKCLHAALVLVAALFAPAAMAQSAAEVVTDHARSRLYPVQQGFEPGATTWFVFEQFLQEGWHVYWKNPGDSGLPLELGWTLPEGYQTAAPVYPTPERIPVGPLANFGHHGAPVFLIPVSAPADAQPGEMVNVRLDATWLICEEICVPEQGSFELVLPVTRSPRIDAEAAARAEAARREAPEDLTADASFYVGDDAIVLTVTAPEGAQDDGYFFPEAEGLIEPAAAQRIERRGDQLVIAMQPGFAAEDAGEEISGVYAFDTDNGRRGYAFKASRRETAIAPPVQTAETSGVAGGRTQAGDASSGGAGLAYLLFAAFLGGAILNVMPCVFPVIFIKAASLMKAAGADRGAIRRDGFFYTAGVIATFAALGGVLIALRAGGEQLGWGFHLQSPIVVLASAYVLLLVGLNLSGVFEIGTSMQGLGSGLATKKGAAGSFFTGLLAVAVAAPCIGPFLTAPIGAAAFLPPALGLMIFIVMGLGLAAPYLALALWPRLGALLPKPGAWMDTLKQALAFPVFGGAAFFLWVLAQQAGPAGLAAALAGAVLLAFAAWLFQRGKGARGSRAVVARIGAGVAALLAIAPVAGVRAVDTARAAPVSGSAAIAFAPDRITELRTEGRAVFVDFTAAWCVTCQVNKLTVLSRDDIKAAFSEGGVAFMVADWTRRDPVITEALAGFGANGVPLYVFYPPSGEPVVLPQPLTAENVIAVVNGASIGS